VIGYMVEELKITPIIDLIHYGCPLWLERGFANKDYPQRVAEYSAAAAERYKHLTKCYTPLNEPIITALIVRKNERALAALSSRWKRLHKIDAADRQGIIRTVKAIKGTSTPSR
jgi:beta-glucosidase/6-phospho-beta-glucosidase/beta-galactosidase